MKCEGCGKRGHTKERFWEKQPESKPKKGHKKELKRDKEKDKSNDEKSDVLAANLSTVEVHHANLSDSCLI